MTAILQVLSSDHPPHTTAVPPGPVVITVRGEVDLLTSPVLQDHLLAHLHDTVPQLIVDLTEVDFLGAAGLSVLATVRSAALAAGTELCLVARTRPVLLPLTITGMHTLFDVHPDLAHALRVTQRDQQRRPGRVASITVDRPPVRAAPACEGSALASTQDLDGRRLAARKHSPGEGAPGC